MAYLEDLESRVDPKIRTRVEKVVRLANVHLRNALREETGLGLRRGQDPGEAIRTEVAPGYPTAVAPVLERSDIAAAVALSNALPALRKIREAGNELLERLDVDVLPLEERERIELRTRGRQALSYWVGLAARLIERYEEQYALGRRILAIAEDTLGLYKTRERKIELYWLPMAIIANDLGVTVEGVGVTVLAHELAHAFTHAGRDIDGDSWPPQAFMDADQEVVEGFAMYYEARTTERVVERFPDAHRAYGLLLPAMPDVYRVHLPWLETGSPEAVRSALIECRRRGLKSLRAVEAVLQEAKRRLQKSSAQQPDLPPSDR